MQQLGPSEAKKYICIKKTQVNGKGPLESLLLGTVRREGVETIVRLDAG